MSTSLHQPDASVVTRQRRGLILAAVIMATFMAAVENTIVATAMPTIVADLGDFHLFSWVFAAYLLTQAVTIPIYGKLADIYGRKRAFFSGAALFLTGSALCGFAPHMQWLILFRAIQGFGAGAVQPVAYTIIGDIYAPSERPRIQGILSTVFGIAALAGPSLGAFLVTHGKWPVIFWVNLPIGVAAVAMLAAFYHDEHRTTRRPVDYLGSVLLMVGGGLLMVALVQAANLSQSVFVSCLVSGAVVLVLLFVHERRVAEPMLPLNLWRNPVVILVSLGSCGMGAIMIGVSAFLPTYLQGVLGYGPTAGGISLAAMSVSWAVATFIAGRIMVRHSYRLCALIGGGALTLGALGFIVMLFGRGAIWAAGTAFVIGLGMGCCNTTYVVAAQAVVAARDRGAATSSNLFMRIVGQAIGAASFGAAVNLGIRHFMPDHPDIVDQLMEPSLRAKLGAAALSHLVPTLNAALASVFVIMVVIGVVVTLLGSALPRGLSARSAPTKR